MSKQTIIIGDPNSNNGDVIYTAFQKVNSNFTELYDLMSLQTGEGGSGGGVATIDIKGNVLSSTNEILVDSAAGKVALQAMPDNVPLTYTFKATFLMNGKLDTIQNLPVGWTFTNTTTQAVITHNVGRRPLIVSYWGFSVADGYRLRYPTAGYQITTTAGGTYPLTLNLNTAATGADVGHHALITVLF